MGLLGTLKGDQGATTIREGNRARSKGPGRGEGGCGSGGRQEGGGSGGNGMKREAGSRKRGSRQGKCSKGQKWGRVENKSKKLKKDMVFAFSRPVCAQNLKIQQTYNFCKK